MVTMPPDPAVLAVVLVMMSGLTGCDVPVDREQDRRPAGAASAPAPLPEDGPAAAYAGWVEALARQDAAAACALQAPEFTIALRYDAILADRAELGDPCPVFEAVAWEDPGFDPDPGRIEVTHQTGEDAILAVDGADGARTVTMVRHRARWRVLATEDRNPGTAERWVATWCELDVSMTRDRILALMGEPSGEYTVADGGEPQLWWARDPYDFRAYLDPVDGSVLELVGDYDALGAADRSRLTCPELRS